MSEINEEEYEVRLAGVRLGQEEWGIWNRLKKDWVRDENGLVETRITPDKKAFGIPEEP